VKWEVETLEEITVFITSGSRGWAKYYSIEGSNFIRITNLKRNQIDISTSDMKYVKLPKGVEGIRSKLNEGDLLISITADLGIIGIVSNDLGDSYINQHIALVRLNSTKVSPTFIGYYYASDFGQSSINLMNDGGAKAGLNLNTILKLPILSLLKSEQDKIVQKIESNKALIDSYENERSKLQRLKTGLMQDLLSGKKRVTSLLNKEHVS